MSPEGRDQNPGTETQPIATFHAARKAVRKRPQEDDEDDIVVAFSGGRYTIREPVKFGPPDSASTHQNVIYRARKGETPIFTGGHRITGWEKNNDGTWSTTIDAVQNGEWTLDELFAGNRRARPARYPDDGTLRVKSIGEDRRTNFTFHEGDIPDVAYGDQLHLMYFHDWSISHVPIKSIDRTVNRLTTANDIGPSASHYRMGHFSNHPRYALTGDVDFVTAPGEWFLNEQTGTLTYKPYDGHRPDQVHMVAPVANALLTVGGTPENPVRNLQFNGLTFRHCSFPRPENGYAAGQATGHDDRSADGSGRTFVDAALTFDHTSNNIVRNCTLSQLGGAGIWLRTGSDANQLLGNQKVPRIRYNNTRKSIITKRNNTVKIRDRGTAPNVQSRIDEAGPKPDLLEESGPYPFR